MPRYFAFLRAINVGGRTVKMDVLRQYFAQLGFINVETFIASGNVIFETQAEKTQTLEQKIEQHLREVLSFEVGTFIRTEAELTAIVDEQPFPLDVLTVAQAYNVAFLSDALNAAAQKQVMGLRTDIDEFRVRGREVYWLCRRKQSASKFSNAVLEKNLGWPATIRGFSTLQKLAVKYSV